MTINQEVNWDIRMAVAQRSADDICRNIDRYLAEDTGIPELVKAVASTMDDGSHKARIGHFVPPMFYDVVASDLARPRPTPPPRPATKRPVRKAQPRKKAVR